MRLTSVTISTPAPAELAGFYARLLGWQVTAEEEEDGTVGWAQVKPQVSADGPTLNFEFERHFTRPVWPAVAGAQRATEHLDIWVRDLPASVQWALSCGAELAEFQPQQDVRVLFDPHGHPFCLFT